jgi:sarcosine oxidase subunit delta
MIVLRCPYCHEQRTEEELTYGGEAGITRPSLACSDAEWTDYLFMRTNPKGVNHEQWCCSAGCAQWFVIARHTVTHEVTEIRRSDDPFTSTTSAAQSDIPTAAHQEGAGRVHVKDAPEERRS